VGLMGLISSLYISMSPDSFPLGVVKDPINPSDPSLRLP
jgi:hypothetical protein